MSTCRYSSRSRPLLRGLARVSPALLSAPFFVAGGLKIVYDLLLYRSFKKAEVK
jgi:hypothetical protein